MREIYFYPLDLALSHIGSAIELEAFVEKRADFIMTWQVSQAAANLHQVFHNVPEGRPKWLTPHPVTRRPVATEEAAARGMTLLEDLSGWYSRYCTHHVRPRPRDAESVDIDALVKGAYSYKFKSGKLGADGSIGFDRSELVRYLDSPQVDIRHTIRAGQTPEYIDMLHARRRAGVPEFTAPREQAVIAVPIKRTLDAKRPVPRLTLPANADAWAKAIEATYDAIAREVGNTPKSHEVWVRMHHKPPDNYPVTITKDRGLPAIALPGERPLTRDGFNKRWRRYTSAINPQARTTSDKSG